MSGIFPTFGWFSLGIKQALLYVMLANVCVEHRYEVSLYRHSAFFTIILVFFLCHCPAFLVYVIVRFFLFMSFPDALLFQSLPAPLNVIARLDRAICLRLRLSRFRILRSSRSMTTTKAITFLFVSLPDALLFQSLPDLIGQSNSLSSGICGFSPCHLRLLSLSSAAFLSVIIRLDRIIHAAEYHFLCHLLSRPPGEA